MLRASVAALALVLASGCSGGTLLVDAADVQHDYALPDIVIDGAPILGDATDAANDVAPTVDILPFDTAAPMPDTASGDASIDAASSCSMLADSYAITVRSSKACVSDSDCSLLVCETLCCNCQVYVNPRAGTETTLMSLQNQWQADGCASSDLCVPQSCEPATSAVCSSAGICVTLRPIGSD